ncbi:MAG: hypothetical protein HYX63_15950 [Gammaproteobacteria bacterium]|nr:hypothetical protein [Gammaproteobacteria bacterium]
MPAAIQPVEAPPAHAYETLEVAEIAWTSSFCRCATSLSRLQTPPAWVFVNGLSRIFHRLLDVLGRSAPEFRLFGYLWRLPPYVLHCFQKKMQVTSVRHKAIATVRYRVVVNARKAKK